MKNHYLMTQVADMVKQLYEWYFLKKNEIKKKQKNISSELLASFGRQLTREDILEKTKKEKPSTRYSIAKEVMLAKREIN